MTNKKVLISQSSWTEVTIKKYDKIIKLHKQREAIDKKLERLMMKGIKSKKHDNNKTLSHKQ